MQPSAAVTTSLSTALAMPPPPLLRPRDAEGLGEATGVVPPTPSRRSSPESAVAPPPPVRTVSPPPSPCPVNTPLLHGTSGEDHVMHSSLVSHGRCATAPTMSVVTTSGARLAMLLGVGRGSERPSSPAGLGCPTRSVVAFWLAVRYRLAGPVDRGLGPELAHRPISISIHF
jgi:hypothetical protein